MATLLASHKNKSPQKPFTFSKSEIEAAKQLIQLSSSGDSEEDRHSSNNSCSYSVVQGKQHQNKVDSCNDVSLLSITGSIEGVLSESEDEIFARTNKRYRDIEELYSVTAPLHVVKPKKKMMMMMKFRKGH